MGCFKEILTLARGLTLFTLNPEGKPAEKWSTLV
jgi:hypothetical protein